MDEAEEVSAVISGGGDLEEIRAICARDPVKANSVIRPGFDPATVREDARQTRIVVHSRFPTLVEDFLAHKRKHGSSVEKKLYRDALSWTWERQVSRLGKSAYNSDSHYHEFTVKARRSGTRHT